MTYLNSNACGFSRVDKNRCSLRVSFDEAKDICKDLGARVCTLQELRDDVASDSGCNLDAQRVWSSTLCRNGYVTGSGGSAGTKNTPISCGGGDTYAYVRCCADVRSRFSGTPPSSVATVTSNAFKSTLSCDELGWDMVDVDGQKVCGASLVQVKPDGGLGCSDRMTFAEATRTCATINARLCTHDELAAGATANTGCALDTRRVWTSTLCGGGAVSQAGNGEYFDFNPPLCVPLTYQYKVRCCADQLAIALRSKSSCSDLQWAPGLGSPDVCAASQVKQLPGGEMVCGGQVSHQRATGLCSAVGARLCTPKELMNDEAKNGGCILNMKRVWSNEPCPLQGDIDSGIQTLGASRDADMRVQRQCSDPTDQVHVVCCADRVARPPTPATQPRAAKSMATAPAQPSLPNLRAATTNMESVKDNTTLRKTCRELGWVKNDKLQACAETMFAATDGLQHFVCPALMDRDNAVDFCESKGGRLCSVIELFSNIASGLSCARNPDKVWAADKCQNPSEFVVAQKARATDDLNFVYDCESVDNQKLYKVVCCSDFGIQETVSRKPDDVRNR